MYVIYSIYFSVMKVINKPIVWLHGEIKTPPFTSLARLEVGFLLRLLQDGIKLSLPHSRPLPIIGSGCHELRIIDEKATWRIIYCIDSDAVIILEVFKKKTNKISKIVIENCKRRLKEYINA
jgi:phage-related protein